MKGDCLNEANSYATGTSLPVITWKKLSLIFPGRSELDIKNAYHSFQRHKLLKSSKWEMVLEDSNPKPLVGNDEPDYQFWQKDDDELWNIMENLIKKTIICKSHTILESDCSRMKLSKIKSNLNKLRRDDERYYLWT